MGAEGSIRSQDSVMLMETATDEDGHDELVLSAAQSTCESEHREREPPAVNWTCDRDCDSTRRASVSIGGHGMAPDSIVV